MEKYIEMEKHILGKVVLYQSTCPYCGQVNLEGKKNYECGCGMNIKCKEIKRIKVIVNPKSARKPWSKKLKEELRVAQKNKCYWCGRSFGTWIWNKGKAEKLRLSIDHIVPYGYTQNHKRTNLIGSCHICNGFKSSKMFDSKKDCLEYILNKWTKRIKTKKILVDF